MKIVSENRFSGKTYFCTMASRDAYGAADGVEVEAEGLLQQIQLYNVALKQEDGEPVTEDEIRQEEWDGEIPSGTGMYPINPSGPRVVPGWFYCMMKRDGL